MHMGVSFSVKNFFIFWFKYHSYKFNANLVFIHFQLANHLLEDMDYINTCLSDLERIRDSWQPVSEIDNIHIQLEEVKVSFFCYVHIIFSLCLNLFPFFKCAWNNIIIDNNIF